MIKKCLICGSMFNSNNGKKYCSDNCRAKATREIQRNYYSRKAITSSNSVATIKRAETSTQKDIVIETLDKSIKDNLEMLDMVREELQKITNELKARQSAYDQKDLETLHAIEGAVNDNVLLDVARKCKENRKNRRNYKNYIKFLVDILKGIPVDTSKQFEDIGNIQGYKDTFYSIKYTS